MPEPIDRERLSLDLPVGGQAVIEGVMMRVPGRIVAAVRAADRRIIVREEPHRAWTQRWRWLDLPVLRGALAFFEMMIIGLRMLNFSADVALEGERRPDQDRAHAWRDRASVALTLAVSLALGIGLFFFLPLFVAQLTGISRDALPFNLVAGGVRLTLFLAYLWGISRWREIQRVFQYHGAEHKSIFTFEAGAELTVEEARRFQRQHPRCGTSFLLIVVLLAILVFALTDSGFAAAAGRPQTLLERFATHLAVLPLISGLGYELLKLSGRQRHHPAARVLMAPGLWLQGLTTREPSDDQLEVAVTALRHALGQPGVAAYTVVR
jgi:uncharacterized protein YqhQ